MRVHFIDGPRHGETVEMADPLNPIIKFPKLKARHGAYRVGTAADGSMYDLLEYRVTSRTPRYAVAQFVPDDVRVTLHVEVAPRDPYDHDCADELSDWAHNLHGEGAISIMGVQETLTSTAARIRFSTRVEGPADPVALSLATEAVQKFFAPVAARWGAHSRRQCRRACRLMPARLIQGDGVLLVKLGGSKEEFAAQLARVKTMPGKRYNPSHPEHGKVWEVPDDDGSLLKLVATVEPEMAPGLLARVRSARQEQATELVTQLPDDAELSVPWAPLLAPAQRSGVDFMLEAAGARAILGDAMGAGKSVQSITAVHEYLLRHPDADASKPRLIIAPAAVLDHWQRELRRWLLGIDLREKHLMQLSPILEDREAMLPAWQDKLAAWGAEQGLTADSFHIIDAKTPEKRAAQLANAIAEPGSWVLVNWEKLQRRVKLVGESTKKRGPLDKVDWLSIIADESHRCRNHDSQTARGLQRLTAPICIAASGTPIMNAPGELFSILHWLRPEQYTSYWAFYHSYTETYKGYQGRDVIIGVKNADGLRFELADKLVRRTKRQIHPDIPEPLDPIVYEPPMSTKQAKIYAEAEKDFWLEVAQAPDITTKQKEEMVVALEDDALSVETVKMMIPNAAARTMRLRQVATSPALLGGDDISSKLDEAEQLVLSNGVDQPFVWFAWFKGTVDLLVKRFQEMGIDARGFHGGNSSREDRARMAAAFQDGEFPIICATIKTGGTGIDLFRASDCGFIEEDWVPGENQQAFDRVDRKGQRFHPQRHILRAPDTVDVGRIAPKLAAKRQIVETITGAME